jgi:hypothetical protein
VPLRICLEPAPISVARVDPNSESVLTRAYLGLIFANGSFAEQVLPRVLQLVPFCFSELNPWTYDEPELCMVLCRSARCKPQHNTCNQYAWSCQNESGTARRAREHAGGCPLPRERTASRTGVPNRSDQSLNVGVLPRALRRSQNFPNVHAFRCLAEFLPIRAAAVAQQIPRGVVPREGFQELSAVHSAVGLAVTAKCTGRRRSWLRITKANKS